MPRLTILAKGNADLRGSLHMLSENGEVVWNGLNELVRERHPEWTARVIHETMTRSDAVLDAASEPPSALADRELPLGPFPVAAQFGTRLFDGGADVVVLSIQADVMNLIVSHRTDGHLFYPYTADNWPVEDRTWLVSHYLPRPALDAQQSMANLAEIVARIRTRGNPLVLVYNLSPVVPWEQPYCYEGLSETLAERIGHFNLELIELSRRIGIAIVDINAIVARAGADRVKLDALSLNSEGCRLAAAEVLRILEDNGCFAQAEAA